MKSNKGIAPIIIVLIAAGILVLGGGAYVYMQKTKVSQPQTATVNAEAQNTSGWKTYTDSQYGFSLKYPDINARLKSFGGWTDYNEPKINSRTPFNYNECALAGEGPGSNGSKITIANREYCLITVSAVEPGTASVLYEYIFRIGNEDIGIVFLANFARGQKGDQEEEAKSFFNQILSTLRAN